MDNRHSDQPQLNHAVAKSPAVGFRAWFAANSTYLLIGLICIGVLCWMVDPLTIGDLITKMGNVGKVVLGLVLVIFIHELGHFLAAKWCDVHVETFSIGFGPAIPGCWFKWGETTYMIGLVPLGGYVKMVGEGNENEENQNDPRSFKNKPVWQRMIIISAGVFMNVVLAAVLFMLVYMTHGVRHQPGMVDVTTPGSPGWQKGLKTGSVIRQVGDQDNPYFEQVRPTVAFTRPGVELDFAFSDPNDPAKVVRTKIVPRRDRSSTAMIGFTPPNDLLIPSQSEAVHWWDGAPGFVRAGMDVKLWGTRGREKPWLEDSPASRAEPPLQLGDRIIACSDPADPEKVEPVANFFQFNERLHQLAGKPMVVRVRRKTGEEVDCKIPAAHACTLGLRMQIGPIVAMRDGSPAEKAGVIPADPVKKTVGDMLAAVEVTDVDGTKLRFVHEKSITPRQTAVGVMAAFAAGPDPLATLAACYAPPLLPPDDEYFEPRPVLRPWIDLQPAPAGVREIYLDPERLPHQLDRWATRVEEAEKQGKPVDWHVTLTVLRTEGHQQGQPKVLSPVEWDSAFKYNREFPFTLSAPQSIRGLGLAYTIRTTIEDVVKDSPAAQAGIRRGAVIKSFNPHVRLKEADDKDAPSKKETELAADQWAYVGHMLLDPPRPGVTRTVTLKVDNGTATKDVTVTAKEDPDWPIVERGFLFVPESHLHTARSLPEAVVLGTSMSLYYIKIIIQSLTGMAEGLVDPDPVGPIGIGYIAFKIAGDDFWQFLLFIGMISVNLAVFNFLPIPVLDGGHMVFLIYEAIRRKPASEKVRVAATWMGLVAILGLMVVVVVMDVKRFWPF